jgi:hypothetical protein
MQPSCAGWLHISLRYTSKRQLPDKYDVGQDPCNAAIDWFQPSRSGSDSVRSRHHLVPQQKHHRSHAECAVPRISVAQPTRRLVPTRSSAFAPRRIGHHLFCRKAEMTKRTHFPATYCRFAHYTESSMMLTPTQTSFRTESGGRETTLNRSRRSVFRRERRRQANDARNPTSRKLCMDTTRSSGRLRVG